MVRERLIFPLARVCYLLFVQLIHLDPYSKHLYNLFLDHAWRDRLWTNRDGLWTGVRRIVECSATDRGRSYDGLWTGSCLRQIVEGIRLEVAIPARLRGSLEEIRSSRDRLWTTKPTDCGLCGRGATDCGPNEPLRLMLQVQRVRFRQQDVVSLRGPFYRDGARTSGSCLVNSASIASRHSWLMLLPVCFAVHFNWR